MMRTHVERREVYVPTRRTWFVAVLDVPKVGAVVSPPLPSKGLAKKVAQLVRQEVKP